jgi:hypothetical protein
MTALCAAFALVASVPAGNLSAASMTNAELYTIAAWTAFMLLLTLGGVLVHVDDLDAPTKLSNVLFGSALACGLMGCLVAFMAVIW